MSFKTHLIIILLIIGAVFMLWRLTDTPDAPAPQPAAAVQESPFSITITHASWGLNCLRRMRTNSGGYDTFMKDGSSPADKIREDNVLQKISELCNGKLQCDIALNPDTLGADPMPECRDKALEIEYRCFSYDRPWPAKINSGMLHVSCDKPVDKPATP